MAKSTGIRGRFLCGLLVALVAGWAFAGEGIRVPVSRDAWISAYSSEVEGNNGGSPKLKLKGIQEFFLIDFDPAPFAGQRVVRAQLHLHGESSELLGRVTVSTIVDPWVEGQGTSYDKAAGASSFQWARNGEKRWSGDGPDITGVTLGNGGSLWGFGDASPRTADGWQTIPIDPAVAQARLDGRSEGFFVMDDVGNEYTREGNRIDYRHMPNRFFSSREKNRSQAPYFTLWLEPKEEKSDRKPKPILIDHGGLMFAAIPREKPDLKTGPLPAGIVCRDIYDQPLKSLDLFAARGEAVGFWIEAPVGTLKLTVPQDLEVTLFSAPLVGGHADPLVPLGFAGAPVDPATGKALAFVEIYARKGASTGRRELDLQVGDVRVPLALTVWNVTLPDHLSFIPQMNCYSITGKELPYFRMAHDHRVTVNELRYGWTGKVDREAVPARKADGSWDWKAWDATFGPLLDGSAFADSRRGAVPVEAFYLPLNENWPMDHEAAFRGGYWIENAYPETYWTEFRAMAGEFARHFGERGWTEPMFEFYMNNKVYFKSDRDNRWDACSAPWIFDEPVNTQDFWALRRFGLEYWQGVQSARGPRFTFRADISRPQWQRDLLDGVTSVEVVSGALRPYRDRVMWRAERFDNTVYMYGSANRIGTANSMPAAWCVETWALGGEGVVPWQTMGRAASWKEPDQLSLFYPTPDGPVPSVRLKAFRAGQQLTEYLTMYAALSGQDRKALGEALLRDPALVPGLDKRSEADAGTSLFDVKAGAALEDIRLRLGRWLDAQGPAPRERWHDPRPPVRDPNTVPRRDVVAGN